MLDSFGRDVNYLRVSVTQRCNLNCLYCGAAAPEGRELTEDEIVTIVAACAGVGVTKVRLTGGEPLLRRDIAEIAARLRALPGIQKLGITTNGVLLSEQAAALREAGIDAVNVSLDTLDAAEYRRLTGADVLGSVLDGIDAALAAGFRRVRVNSVLIRGENEDAAERLIALAKDRPVDVRFIELMPFSESGKNEALVIPAAELLARFPFLVSATEREVGVAKYYTAAGYAGRIGFIAPVSDKFCAACNRLRLLSTGELRPCLGYEKTFDLNPVLHDPAKLEATIRAAILSKPIGHNFACAYGSMHAMNKIGG